MTDTEFAIMVSIHRNTFSKTEAYDAVGSFLAPIVKDFKSLCMDTYCTRNELHTLKNRIANGTISLESVMTELDAILTTPMRKEEPS